MSDQLVCWKCGNSIEQLPLPLSRQAECGHCGADLHTCRMCEFYKVNVSNQCSEPVAEYVQDKTRANFCGYFQIRAAAYADSDRQAATDAKKQLESLFGLEVKQDESSDNPDQAKQELEKLFGIDQKKNNK